MLEKKRLGQILLENGIITPETLNTALHYQETTMPNRKLGEILVRLGYANSEFILVALMSQKSPQVDALSTTPGSEIEADTKDVLAISIPPYEMPPGSYEELQSISDPAAPRRGVFPPAPRTSTTAELTPADLEELAHPRKLTPEEWEPKLTPEEWEELKHPKLTPEDEARQEPFCQLYNFDWFLMCVEINKAYLDEDHKVQRLAGFRIHRNEDETNEALAERVSQEFKAAILKILSEHRDDESIEI